MQLSAVKTRRSVAVIAALAATVFTVSACSSGTTATSTTSAGSAASGSAAAGGAKIAAVLKGLDNPFFQTMQDGVDAAAAATGSAVTVQAATSITDTAGQGDKLNSLAGQDFGCFIVNPISGTNLIQGIAQLAAKGVSIVNIDSPLDADAAAAADAKVATYIGTDNTAAGKLGGQTMATLLPQGGNVALIGGISGDVTSGARLDGFESGIPANITVVQTVAADWDRQTALTKATDLMTAQPDLKGFFVANDDMGLGVAQAIANAGKTGQIKVISVDGNKDAFEAVKAGGIDAVVAQFPYVIGEMGVQACEAAIAGKTLPEKVDAPVQVVTKDNVDAALSAAPKPGDSYDNPFAS